MWKFKKFYNRGDKEYRRVPWYEGIYEINEDWQVRSYWRVSNRNNWISEFPQRLLSHRVNRKTKKNVAEVTLFDWEKHKHHYVARLVAQCFMWYDVKDKSKQIIYKDGNSMNPKKNNLKIASVSERTLNGYRLRNVIDW